MAPLNLAPSTMHLIRPQVSAPRIPMTDSDWTMLYPEIERLYVRERRKLRYIIHYIEMKYGLRPTQQMYKKRFAKWGIQKNNRRSTRSKSICTAAVKQDYSSPKNLHAIPVSPELGIDDRLWLTLLTSVRTWNISFYESANSGKEVSPTIQHSWPERYHDMNFTFKLMIDMLNRGYGVLAGRVARKAFLLAEETLMLAGPASMWNILEIMHFMMVSHNLQLFKLFVAHMNALVDVRTSKSHPLSIILRALSTFMADLGDSTASHKKDSPRLSPQLALIAAKEEVVTTKLSLPYNTLLSMIEQAWKLNAEVLFQNFDQRFFQLYLRVHWDTCSIEPPTAIVGAAKQWMADASPPQVSRSTGIKDQSEGYVQITPFESDRMLQSLLVAPTDSVLPEDYEIQRVNSIKILQDRAITILSRKSNTGGESSTLLRILATLVTTKVLEEWCPTTQESTASREMTSMLSRGQAGSIACALRTTMNLDVGKHEDEAYLDNAGQIRSILALREYAKSGTDPRIIREMWLLGDVLVAAGEHGKAEEVKQSAVQRLEQYIQDIPFNSA